jgi:type I restriction enzyme M protein
MPWTDKLWVFDLRTNLHFTLKQSPIQRSDFDEFVECFKPGKMHERVATWSEESPEGRWRCYNYDELHKRDKLSLDLFWIKEKSLTDTDSLPDPGILAAEIAEELAEALEQFQKVAGRLSNQEYKYRKTFLEKRKQKRIARLGTIPPGGALKV